MSDGVFRTDDELDIAMELQRATDKFGPMASPHEAIAVIEEEFLELREAIFWRRSDPRSEAIQLAAMVLRYLRDCNPTANTKESDGGRLPGDPDDDATGEGY